jgi:hypothetical protein
VSSHWSASGSLDAKSTHIGHRNDILFFLSFHLQAKLSSGSLLDMAETIATSYLIAGSKGWKSSTKSSSRQRAPNLVRYMSSYSGVCSEVKCSAVPVQYSAVQCSAVQCSAVV